MKLAIPQTRLERKSEAYFWACVLVISVAPNIYVYLSALSAPTITVDLQVVPSRLSYFKGLVCLALVLATLAFVIFCARYGRKYFPERPFGRPTRTAGRLVFLLQMMGLMSVLLFDFGRVGGAATSSSVIAILTSYLNPDMLFLVYYAHARGRKLPYWNLLLFVVSNSLRGWAGFWSMLFLIELYYAAQRFSSRKMLAFTLCMTIAALIALPYVSEIRDQMRGTVSTKNTVYSDYFDNMVQRLQQLTNVALIAQESQEIEEGLRQGKILPYYRDNQIFEKLEDKLEGGHSRPQSLQKLLTIRYLIDMRDVPSGKYIQDVGWHSATGIAGWLFVLDWKAIPFYLLFVAILIIFPYWVLGRFVGERSLLPMLHIVSVSYMFQGWFGVQIGFCIALILYAFLVNFMRAKPQMQPAYVYLPHSALGLPVQTAGSFKFTMKMDEAAKATGK